jgi:hypothetical protein
LQVEEAGRVFGVLKQERGSLIDRDGAGHAGLVNHLPGVYLHRIEAPFSTAHFFSPYLNH